TDGKLALVASQKKEILALASDPLLTVKNISEKTNIPLRTIYGMIETDLDFRHEWYTIAAQKDVMRTDIVEDSLFKRAAEEKGGNPAETIFYLKNRAPHRWKDKVQQEVTGADGAPLMSVEALRSFLKDDDEAPAQVTAKQRKALPIPQNPA
ncbi:MAG: hypothetical protein GWN55_10490, partial [Phycisphaerae bacterium]|nr:hypothetical protein [Phycisphaerae bacterium]NIV01729.1 hypothetical protein [Phycisphaerae bacterium]NIX00617.1 hypothetical protein [Phycisphaerae bacterium]